MNEMTQNLPATAEQRPVARERIVVQDPIAVLDTARFEQMQRVAMVMARSNLIPSELRRDQEAVMANCFLVVNQAVRWGMDPFAVAQCVSVVKGKLCYEGKLIAAVLDARLGIKLEYEVSGQGEQTQVLVRATKDGKLIVDSQGNPKIVKGTVADWQTTGEGSPWKARGGYPRMLRYRGAREWYRIHEPSIMLGVYSDDEMDDMTEASRAERARPIQVREEMSPQPSQARMAQNATLQPQQQPQEHMPPEPGNPGRGYSEQEVMPPEPSEPARGPTQAFRASEAGNGFREQPMEEMPPEPGENKPSDYQWLADVEAACRTIFNDTTKAGPDLDIYHRNHVVPQRNSRPPDTYKTATNIVLRWQDDMVKRAKATAAQQ